MEAGYRLCQRSLLSSSRILLRLLAFEHPVEVQLRPILRHCKYGLVTRLWFLKRLEQLETPQNAAN